MSKCNSIISKVRSLFLLSLPYNPAKDYIRKAVVITSNILAILSIPFIVYKLIETNNSKAIVCIVPLAINLLTGIIYLLLPSKFIIKNKIIGIVIIADFNILQHLIHAFSINKFFPSSLVLASSLAQLISMNLFFIEHMMIVTICYFTTVIAEASRIIIYQMDSDVFTYTFIQTSFTYTTYYLLSYILIAERSIIFHLRAQSTIDNQIFMQSLDLCQVGFAIFKNGKISFANEECRNLLNIKSISEFSSTIELLGPNIKQVESTLLPNIKHFTINLQVKNIDWKIKQANYGNQEIVMHTFMDMTYIKAMHIAEMHRKSVEMLVATSTHELRSPLNGMKSSFLFLKNQKLSNECNKIIERGLSSCDYQEDLINDIMDFAKIQGDKIKCNSSRFLIKSLIQKCYDTMELPIKDKKLLFLIKFKDSIDTEIYSDERRLRQVILNFLSNSIKFTTKGFIKICTKITKQVCKISVEDSGLGIKSDNIPKLFKEFGMLSDSASKNTSGTGLGLYLSKKLVTLLGGDVHVKSKYQEGSKFSIMLPLNLILKNEENGDDSKCELFQSTVQNTPAMKSPLPIKQDISNLQVLFVDDSPMNLSITERMMKNLGYNVITALSGADALSLIAKHYNQIRVAFIDLHMPLMDGYELADKICELRKSNSMNEFPLIALTGDEKDDVLMDCKMHGYVNVLTKPISQKSIYEIMNTYS